MTGPLALLIVAPETGAATSPALERLRESLGRFNRDDLRVIERHGDLDTVAVDFASTGESEFFVACTCDTVFVRPFGISDFLDERGEPIMFLTEDHDRRASGAVVSDQCVLAGGPPVYRSSDVCELTKAVAARRGPLRDEYVAWLGAGRGSSLEWREPIFLELGGRPIDYSLADAGPADVARGYIGYVGWLPSEAGGGDALEAIPTVELVRAAALRVYSKAPRVRRLVQKLS